MNDLTRELDLLIIPANVVPLDYVMDPKTDDLIFGSDLEVGMVILIEGSTGRANPASKERHAAGTAVDEGVRWSEYDEVRLQETSYWCRIERLQKSGDILSMICVYADGSKRSRTYNVSWTWFVKKDSVHA